MSRVRLHVNVDHVATLRQARGTSYPDPVEAASLCEHAGADGITVHLREDRRHIQDRDVEVLRRTVKSLLNLEMAATEAMIAFATRIKPDLVTLVPEKREERTTEGGLDVAGNKDHVQQAVTALREAGIPVSLFIDPEAAQVGASVAVGAAAVEFHTGDYANATSPDAHKHELARLARAAIHARHVAPTLRIAAGHGLTARNVGELLSTVPGIEELNVGHAIVSDAVLVGMDRAVQRFLEEMRAASPPPRR
jgi:pyridoxine 5-phosphate synthase